MFDFNEILAQMSAGKSPEDIANEFTASLNKAIKAQEKENKAKEKIADAQVIADALNAFGAKHYPDQSTPVTAEQIVDTYELVAGLDVKSCLISGMTTSYLYVKNGKCNSFDDICEAMQMYDNRV